MKRERNMEVRKEKGNGRGRNECASEERQLRKKKERQK
jgi:hypothetical protein